MIRVDLHAHPRFFNLTAGLRLTEWTRPSIDQIALAGFKAGLDVVPITSCHNNLWDYYLGENTQKEYALHRIKEGEILLIPTREIQAVHNGERVDVNIVCPRDDTHLRRIAPKSRILDYVLDAGRASGGLVILAHPNENYAARLLEDGKIDSFEEYNWLENKRVEVPGRRGVAVSDAHRLADYGRAFTIVKTDSRSPEAIKDCIRKGAITPSYLECDRFDLISRLVARTKYAVSLVEAIARGKLGLEV